MHSRMCDVGRASNEVRLRYLVACRRHVGLLWRAPAGILIASSARCRVRKAGARSPGYVYRSTSRTRLDGWRGNFHPRCWRARWATCRRTPNWVVLLLWIATSGRSPGRHRRCGATLRAWRQCSESASTFSCGLARCSFSVRLARCHTWRSNNSGPGRAGCCCCYCCCFPVKHLWMEE